MPNCGQAMNPNASKAGMALQTRRRHRPRLQPTPKAPYQAWNDCLRAYPPAQFLSPVGRGRSHRSTMTHRGADFAFGVRAQFSRFFR